MGKQICFFTTEEDTRDLIKIIRSVGGIIVNIKNQEIKTITDSKAFVRLKSSIMLYDIVGEEQLINQNKSEVIEFSLCARQHLQIIDTSSVDNHFKKGQFLIIDNPEEFRMQMDKLMQNPVYIKNPNYITNGFEHGRFWYNPEYYDVEGNKVIKSSELNSLFGFLQKYIKQHYKLSKDKFGYIGFNAFQKYLEGVFIPCSGKNKINF